MASSLGSGWFCPRSVFGSVRSSYRARQAGSGGESEAPPFDLKGLTCPPETGPKYHLALGPVSGGQVSRTWEPDIELFYYRAWYYSPELGRFTSRDPQGLDDGVNVYAYTHNNPVDHSDPPGTSTWDEIRKKADMGSQATLELGITGLLISGGAEVAPYIGGPPQTLVAAIAKYMPKPGDSEMEYVINEAYKASAQLIDMGLADQGKEWKKIADLIHGGIGKDYGKIQKTSDVVVESTENGLRSSVSAIEHFELNGKDAHLVVFGNSDGATGGWTVWVDDSSFKMTKYDNGVTFGTTENGDKFHFSPATNALTVQLEDGTTSVQDQDTGVMETWTPEGVYYKTNKNGKVLERIKPGEEGYPEKPSLPKPDPGNEPEDDEEVEDEDDDDDDDDDEEDDNNEDDDDEEDEAEEHEGEDPPN